MFRTVSQTNDLCKCPMGRVANLVGDSTSLLIIRDLFSGPKRFSELSTSLAGISTRTLTNKLKLLEKNLMITRTVIVGKPIHVEYCLTKKGLGFRKVEEAMIEFGEQYL